MSEQPRVVHVTATEAQKIVDEAKRAKKVRAFLALALIIVGATALALAVGMMTGTFWASCAIIGSVVLTIGVLLGTNG